MDLRDIYKRLTKVILCLLPDDHLITRRAIMRAGVWMRKQNGILTLEQSKSLVAKERKAFKTWISVGVGLLSVCVQHTITVGIFFLVVGWWSWSVVTWCIQQVTG